MVTKETPIKIQIVKTLSNLQPSRVVVVKGENEDKFSLYVTDKNGIPYPIDNSADVTDSIKDIKNTDGNLSITGFATKTINVSPALLSIINSAIQPGGNVSDLINDAGYLTEEVDPIFQASEASLFESGDKTNLDNQSGINTGDETTASIKLKRPLKTINGDSLEGVGNVQISYDDLSDKPTSFPPSNHTHIIADVTGLQTALDSKQPNLVSGTNIKTIEGQSLIGSGNIDLNKSDVGLSNVDNTSDLAKPISTATQAALNNKEDKNQKGIVNGYTPLDSNNKVPLIHINDSLIGNVNYQGLWNPSTNLPNLTTVGPKGHYYICTADGNRFGIDFKTGDWIISDGTSWSKVDNTDAVSTVFGRTGNVVAQLGDYNTSQVTENTNLYYTEARVNANSNVSANTAARHNAVTLGIANGLSLSTQALSLALASTSVTGALSSTDWNTFNNKQSQLVSGTTIKTIEGQSILGTGNIDLSKSDVGLSNVDNTSDVNKPISTATQTALDTKVNKSGIENSLPILDTAGNNLGAIETNDDHVSIKGVTGVLLDAPSAVVNSLAGFTDHLVGVGLDGQLIPVKRDTGLYAPTATNSTVQNLVANVPTKMLAIITTTQLMTSPTLQWSINFTNTSNQATTVRIKLGLNNVATGTGILYTVPRFTSLTITGASPYAPTIASGTEVSAFIESSTVASVNSVTIKLDSGVSALTVDQTIIDGSTNAVAGNAVFDGLATKVGGTGTTNYISKWTATGIQGGSNITDDGTNVSIINSTARLRGGDNAGRFILGNATTTSYLEVGGSTYTMPNDLSLITTSGSINLFTNAISRIKVVNAGRVLFGTITDNLTDLVQINGTAIATAWKVSGGLVTQYQTGTGTLVDFNTSVRGATLTGYVSGAGTVAATDTVLQAINKLNGNDGLKANLASPALTGVPTAPTAILGDNTTQIATTAFVLANISAVATSGSYTPTVTLDANVTSATVTRATYTKIGNIVTVMINFNVGPTAQNTNTSFSVTLPISRATVSPIALGTGTVINADTPRRVYPLAVYSDTTTKARIDFNPVAYTNGFAACSATFQYSILD